MEVKDFVKQSLLQILDGVHEAQKEHNTGPSSGVINPTWLPEAGWHSHSQDVEFDIAVTVSSKKGNDASAGISVMGTGLKGKLGFSKSNENSSVSRIKFTVPIIPPLTIVTPTDGK